MGEILQGSFATIRNLADSFSDVFYRNAIARGLGQMFNGARDLYAAFGYKRPGELTPELLRQRYERSEIAGTVCDTWPDATWKAGAQVLENEDVENKTEFEKAFVLLDERLQVWSAFRRTDILAQMGDYATLLIGAPGQLSTPLPRMQGQQAIAYLQPYGQDTMVVETLDDDPTSPRFGLPATYRLKRASNKFQKVAKQKLEADRIVHWSRIVHAAEGLLDDNVFSANLRLRRCWNRIDDLDKVAGAGSEAFYRRAHQGTVIKLDKDLQITEPELKKAQEQVDEFEHELRRVIKLRGADVKQLGSDVADFSNPVDCLLKLISAGSRIPKRIFEGSERGELASTTDQENFDSRVNDRRSQYAHPVFVKQFVDRLISVGGLPTPKDKKFFTQWPDNSKTPTERAELALKYAEINDKAKIDIVKPNEIRDRGLGWEADPDLEDLPIERQQEKPPNGNTNEPEPDASTEPEPDADESGAEDD